jgi:hypothetical protein
MISRSSNRDLFQQGKKSLAYVIAIMNMILHGIEAPNVLHTNTLTENLADIQEKDRLRRGAGESALRRGRAQGGRAELSDPYRRDRLPVSPALHPDFEGGRPRRNRNQEYLFFRIR